MIKNFNSFDKVKNYQSSILYVMIILWSALIGLTVITGPFPLHKLWLLWLIYFGVSVSATFLILRLNRLGYTHFASWLFIIMLWLYTIIPYYLVGTMFATRVLSQISIILIARFLLGWRIGLAVGIFTLVTNLLIAYSHSIFNLPYPFLIHISQTQWVFAIIPFSTILVLQNHTTNHEQFGLTSFQGGIQQQKKLDNLNDQGIYKSDERIKELKVLYTITSILKKEEVSSDILFREVADAICQGWQFPNITAVRINIAEKEYTTLNFSTSKDYQKAEKKTSKGTKVAIEVVYLHPMPKLYEGPFLKEERSLINMLAEMLKMEIERREFTAALKDYKYALDITSIVSIAEVDGTISYVNESFCQASKYSSEELIGRDRDFIWSEHHSQKHFSDLQIAMEAGKLYKGEFCNVSKDGELYWVDSTFVPFLDEKRKVHQYLSISYDITKRKEIEEKIRQSQERYKSIITVSNTAAWEYHIDTDTIWFSEEYFSMIGLDRPEGTLDKTLATYWSNRLHPDDRKFSINLFDNYLKTKSEDLYENTFRMWHEAGHWVWIWSRAKRLQDNNGNLTNVILGTHIDITKRITAEEKTKQNEQLLKKTTSQIPCNTYLFELDESGYANILFMSRGTDTFNHPHSFESLGDHHEKIREVIHHDDKAIFNDDMKKAYQTNSAINLQYRIIINGHIRWRLMQAVPEISKTGKTLWYAATSDITPLFDYISTIEQMVYDINHVIRRPIASMLGITRLIAESELDENEIKEFSQKLYLISDEMDKFIHELNEDYQKKVQNTNLNIRISSIINERKSLFE